MDVDRAGTDELAHHAVSVAQGLRDSAEPIRRLRWGGAVSGRDYVEHGAALASALAVLNSRLTGRADLLDTLGRRLFSSAQVIAEVDREGAQRLRDSDGSAS
ncbi:hypothetical protein QM716_06200 [Rhodococcus sp. IEGM 1409]|uniref:hypothetical protein n=1 Tax=Rhodococcus sp. IEGM 1409 TaxID=3047082 RepID=UPI0024B86AD2|nr:hypothetical protein [Rhodococcus sp. IEGM 1409]MDI9899441.1 hypothetical protein [Rhodococcus sp. IEGM 1409]